MAIDYKTQQLKEEFRSKWGDILKKGNLNIDENFDKATKLSTVDFIEKIKTGGDWDYKSRDDLLRMFGDSRLAEFGNVHFGIMAVAQGYPYHYQGQACIKILNKVVEVMLLLLYRHQSQLIPLREE